MAYNMYNYYNHGTPQLVPDSPMPTPLPLRDYRSDGSSSSPSHASSSFPPYSPSSPATPPHSRCDDDYVDFNQYLNFHDNDDHCPSSPDGSLSPASTRHSTKTRRLNSPDKTAMIRENGACLRCRIKKTGCGVGVCSSCQSFAPHLCHEVCAREHLPQIGKVFQYFRDYRLPSTERTVALQQPTLARVYLSPSPSAAALDLPIQLHGAQNASGQQFQFCSIYRPRIPNWTALIRWAEEQILLESAVLSRQQQQHSFQHEIVAFASRYIASGNTALPKYHLFRDIHSMKCMFRIWNERVLYTVDDRTGQVVPLDRDVQQELQQIAKKALESLERDVMMQLDECVSQQGLLKSGEKATFWAALWELVSVYQQLLRACLDDEQQYALVRKVYVMLLVLYAGHYDKPKSLALELDLGACQPLGLADELAERFGALLANRVDFYRSCQPRPDDEAGVLLYELIAKPEAQRLSPRKRTKKTATAEFVLVSPEDPPMMVADPYSAGPGYYHAQPAQGYYAGY